MIIFFNSLSFAAFNDHGVISLWTAAYTLLSYIAHNCRWADEYLQKYEYHELAKGCLLGGHIPVRPETIASFLVELMRISYESFSIIFDPDIFNYFVGKMDPERARNACDKIWVLEMLLGILSIEWYDNKEPIEQIVCGLKHEMENCNDIDYINELCFSCLASILASNIEPEFKKICFDESIIGIGIEKFNPDSETLFSSIIDYFNNLVFFDDAYFSIFVDNGIIGHIADAIKKVQTKERVQLKQKLIFFLNTCLAIGKPALAEISKFDIFSYVVENYDYAPLRLRKEIILYSCSLLMHSDVTLYKGIFDTFPLENIIDALMENDDEMNGRILVALIQMTSSILVAPDDSADIIEELSDSSMENRLEEFADISANPLSECAIILRKNIVTLQESK